MEIASADQEPPPDDSPLQRKAKDEEKPIQLKEEDEEKPIQLKEKDEEKPVQLKSEKEEEPVQLAAEGAASATPSASPRPAAIASVLAPPAASSRGPGSAPSARAAASPRATVPTRPAGSARAAAPAAASARIAAPTLGPAAASTRASAPAPTLASVRAPALSMQDAAAAAIASPGAGSMLPAATRGALELRMGVDLGAVRVHDGPDAQRSAALLNARAFTHGRHIWLGRGESAGDLRLMAHEVTHVLQQDGVIRRKPGDKKKPAGSSAPSAEAPAPAAPAPAAPAPPAPAAPGASPDALREPQMPPPPEALSAEEQARLQQVDAKADAAVEATTDLPPAEEKVGDARDAVKEPPAETSARAGDALVEALGDRPAPSPEIEALCQQIRTLIHSKQPPNEKSLVNAKPREMAAQAGGQLNSAVEGDAKRVQGQYDQLKTPPAGTPEKTPEPLPPPPGAAETPALGAANAAPQGVPAEKVSLDADVKAGQQQMADAGMDSEPAKLVKDGPIAEARAAHGELAETAARDPQEVMAEQQAVVAGTQADMAKLQAAALAALQGSREKTATDDQSQQTGMVGSEEQMRTKAGADAQRIFDAAQTRVNELLTPLPRTAMARWEAGVKVLSTAFEQSLSEVKTYLDERYKSTTLVIWDALTGMPGWIKVKYDRAEKDFGDGVCKLIREISTEVNGVVAACETIIDTSRRDIDAVFAKLPTELQGWAAEQQASFGQRLDGLAQKAQQTKADFNKQLTEKAAQAVQEVREKIHALREAAKGLLGKLADAVTAFLEDPAKFIIEGLLKVLGIEPSAFWALVNRIGEAIDKIANDPASFASNLASALKKGFQQFFDNIGTHLLKGLVEWLFSGLGSVGVALPADTSLKSIITFFLQLMGLSWANIRKILAKHIGEKNVALIEKAWELVSMLIEKGPEGIFEMVKEQLDPANLLGMVLDAAKDYIIETLIKAVTPRILGLFNPAGAVLEAIRAIYTVLEWIFNNAAKIFALVETVVAGVTDLIAGNIGGMATAVEGALAKTISPVIDFLAGYVGLGDLPEKIAGVIKGFQAKVLAVVDKIIGALAKRARDLLAKLGIGKDKVEEDDPEKAKKVAAGLADIDAEEAKVVENGKLSHDEARGVAARVKKNHPVFSSLEVIDGGDSWNYRWKASPGDVKDTPAKKEETPLPFGPGDRVSVMHPSTRQMEEGVVEKLDEKNQIAWFRLETGKKTRASSFGLPYATAADPGVVQKRKEGEMTVPPEPYDREKHYGKTPTEADRAHFGASGDPTIVIDHDPPLVVRYYEMDPTTGKPGYQMTPAQRRASANNRKYMSRQPSADSHKQGAEMSKYSKDKKGKYGF
jgi:hypothetical protein